MIELAKNQGLIEVVKFGREGGMIVFEHVSDEEK